MYTIPKEIEVDGQSYIIRAGGDYRMILDCFSILEDAELSKEERIVGCLFIFYDFKSLDELLGNEHLQGLTEKMFEFFNLGNNDDNAQYSPKLMDWKQDEQLICAAVNKVAGTEVRSVDYIHWWTFMGYYMSIGESLYSTILQIRDKIVKGKKLEKYEREFRSKNPQYFNWNSKTIDQREADEWLKEVWNSGK